MTTEIVQIALESIDPSPFQTRRFTGSEGLDDLAASIASVGVLQPVLVRTGRDGRYELLAGERRVRASRLANATEIPAIVRDVDDDAACEICVTENLQREDLHPLDQAAAIGLLLDRHTMEEVAARLGRSVAFVARRSRLTTLTESWRDAIANGKGEFDPSGWGVLHLEVVAKLPSEDQDALLGFMDHWHSTWTVRQLDDAIDRMLHLLSTAPWDISNPNLKDATPACSGCQLRSSANPGLFDDDGDGDRCLSSACWKRKLQAHIEDTRQKMQEDSREPVLLFTGDWDRRNDPNTVMRYDCQFSDTPKKGYTVALAIDGEHAGRLVYVKRHDNSASGTAPKKGPKTMEEKREGLRRRRLKLAIERVLLAIRETDAMPDTAAILALAASIGTQHTYHHGPGEVAPSWMSREDGGPSGSLANILEKRHAVAHEHYLWREQLLKVIEGRNLYQPGIDIEASWTEVTTVADLVGIAAAPFLKRTTEEIKEPKSWAGSPQRNAA
jgi:ParB/RepB/Spo0J family partition protein